MEKDLFIKTLIDNIFSKKKIEEVKKRAYDIEPVFNIISRKSFDLHETSDIPRIEFVGSIQRFLLGSYLDSIYFAITSIELALLLRLDQKLTQEEKNQLQNRINNKRYNLTLGNIIHQSKSKGIIGPDITEEIDLLLIARNSHFHPATFLSGLIIQEKKIILPQINNTINDLQVIQKKFPLLSRISIWRDSYNKLYNLFIEKKEVLENLDDLEWATPSENRRQIENEVDEILEEYRKNVKYILPYGRDQPIMMLLSFRNLKKKYLEITDENNYLKKRATNIILNSLKILEYLGFY